MTDSAWIFSVSTHAVSMSAMFYPVEVASVNSRRTRGMDLKRLSDE